MRSVLRAAAIVLVLSAARCASMPETRPSEPPSSACDDDCERDNTACVARCAGSPAECRQQCSHDFGACRHACAAQPY